MSADNEDRLVMIAAFSIASFAGGTAVSCFSDRLPVSRVVGEFVGGVLLVFSLVLIGIGVAPICR